MKKISCFILGIVSYVCFIPILESLVELICGFLETLKINNTKKVMKGNNEIANLQLESEPTETCCMGFQIDDDNYDDWEDE